MFLACKQARVDGNERRGEHAFAEEILQKVGDANGGAKGVGGGGKGEIAVENAFPNEARDAAEQNSGCYQRGRVAGAFGCHFSRRKLPATMESMPEE